MKIWTNSHHDGLNRVVVLGCPSDNEPLSHLATWTTLFNHDLNRICPMHDSSVIDCDLDSTPRRVICISHSNLNAKKGTLDKIEKIRSSPHLVLGPIENP